MMSMSLLCVALWWGQPPEKPATREPAREVKVTIVRAENPRPDVRIAGDGLIAVRDAETGELRAPTAEERAFFTEQMSLRAPLPESVPETVAPDGTITAVLGPAFQSYSIAVRDADGKLVTTCVASAAEARALLAGEAGKKERTDER